MKKQQFLEKLKKGLCGLPEDDVNERLTFYSEAIDDRMEDGLCEEEAVSNLGNIDDIIKQTVSDIPLSKIAKEKIKKNRSLKGWEITLLAIGSPIWLSLLIAAFAVILSLYIALWSVIISLWSVFVSFAACGIAGIVSGIALAFLEDALTGAVVTGGGLICMGLAIFSFYGCKSATKGVIILTKKMVFSIKKRFIKKEDAQ